MVSGIVSIAGERDYCDSRRQRLKPFDAVGQLWGGSSKRRQHGVQHLMPIQAYLKHPRLSGY